MTPSPYIFPGAKKPGQNPTPEFCIEKVFNAYGHNGNWKEMAHSKCRKPEVVEPKQMSMYLLLRYFDWSHKDISVRFLYSYENVGASIRVFKDHINTEKHTRKLFIIACDEAGIAMDDIVKLIELCKA